MKKNLYALLLTFAGWQLIGQTVIFHENFDLPSGADSVSQGYLGSPTSATWNVSNSLATSPTQSFHFQGTKSIDTVYFETTAFSTVGTPFVSLSFNHIAKLYPLNQARIQISIDGGVTWTYLSVQEYLGADQLFNATGWFNASSHVNFAGTVTPWAPGQNAASPDNTWWKKELFDLSDIASDLTSMTGYPDVRIRFVAIIRLAYNAPQMPPLFSAGWFVDDVKVIASGTCEVIPPTINTNYAPVPCYTPLPQGFVPAPSNTVPLGILATDQGGASTPSGVDSAAVFYKINNGSITNLEMLSGGMPNEYTNSIAGLSTNDTVDYYIMATDNCGNTTRVPDTGFYQFIVSSGLPGICGFGDCAGLPSIINSFPWSEDFEGSEWVLGTGSVTSGSSHRGSIPMFPNGNWTWAPPLPNGFGWSVQTGPTPSPFSGPSGDHTSGGGKYLYTELTQATSSIFARVITPCIDLTDSTTRTFSFYYHMYGPNIDRLRIHIDTGSSSAAWVPYHQIVGAQQASPSDPWKKASVSLEPFRGRIIRILIGSVDSGPDSDIAIDDLSIEDAVDDDVALFAIKSPVSNTCASGNSVPVEIVVQNAGYLVKNSIPVAYQLNAGTVVRDTLTGVNLSLMDTASFSFAQTLNLSPSAAHSLKVWTEWGTDVNVSNDTMEVSIPISSNAVISSFPYFLDFEDATVNSGNGVLNNLTWELNTTSNGNGARWTVASGMRSNFTSGLLHPLGKNSNYLLFRDEAANTADMATFSSKCIDLGGLSSPELSFQYHISPGELMEVLVKTLNNPWQQLTLLTGQTSQERKFLLHQVDLSSYAGQQIELAFRVGGSSTSNDHIAALDNIVVKEDDFNDLSIRMVSENITNLEQNSTALPNITVNFSATSSSTTPASLGIILKHKCGGSNSYFLQEPTNASSWSGTINNRQEVFSSLAFAGTLQPGEYDYKIWIESTQDSLAFNDTIYGETVVRPVHPVPYFQDFETCAKDFATKGSNYQWEITTPEKSSVPSAYSGNRCALTNADHPFVSSDPFEYLVSPGFEGLDTLAGVELRFRQKFNFGGGGYGLIQYNNSGSWDNLLPPHILSTPAGSNMYASPEGPAYNGSSSNWDYTTHSLDHVKSNSPLYLRFTAKASMSQGWAIDDFEIYVPPQNSASPIALIFDQGSVQPTNAVSLELFNSGAKTLDNAEVSVYANGNPLFTENLNFSGLDTGKDEIVSLQNTLNLSTGNTELLIVTSRPNNRNDAFPIDDTLLIHISRPGEVSNLPYCNDFETGSDFLAFDLKNKSVGDFWKWTTPVKTNIQGAHSGTNAWVTGDSADYPALVDKVLYTPAFNVEGSQCYKFSFWHNYDTEYNFDGGNVEVSIDSGKTWTVLGNHGDSTWYNTPYIQSLSYVNPGFSGNSGGWVESWQEFKIFNSGQVMFRFRFASNASNSGDGWAIDDVCFEEITETCKEVSLEEELKLQSEMSLFPNPATEQLNVQFNNALVTTGTAAMSIIDQSGRVIKDWKQELNTENTFPVDISKLPAGIYSLKADLEGASLVKFFVKL